MISLYDGQITDLLPWKMAQSTEVRCISYAVRQEHQRMLRLAENTRIMSFINGLPERVLDVLAVELRAPYYEESMEIETKRDIIRNTMKWHSMAGTPGAVEELVQVIFGEGEVVEWWNYEDDNKIRGTFDIVTNARQTPDQLDRLASIIKKVKNTRSHLRAIKTHREIRNKITFANALISTSNGSIPNSSDRKQYAKGRCVVAASVTGIQNNVVHNSAKINLGDTTAGINIFCCLISQPKTIIQRTQEV